MVIEVKKKVMVLLMLILALGSVNIVSASSISNEHPESTINTFEVSLEDRQYFDELIANAKKEGKYNFSYAVPLVEPKNSYFQPFASALPYDFTFNFDSYLSSQDYDNKKSTVYISTKAKWESTEAKNRFLGTDHNYYDIELYDDNGAVSVVRYPVVENTTYTGTFKNVAVGEVSFTMSKPSRTWSEVVNGDEIFDGDVIGNGTIKN